MIFCRLFFVLVLSCAVTDMVRADQPIHKSHAMSMYGDIKYGPDATHFDYANPDAPKGGTARLAVIGTFDSLNGFILKGTAAAGLGYLYNSLTDRSLDEAFSEYGTLAESMEVPADRSWVIFTLRPEARWHDGKPVTVEDVIFTLGLIKEKFHPGWRNYYADVEKAEKVGERRVKFTFAGEDNRELPLIAGQIPILPKHYWEGRNFEETTLEPPLGSGPYRIDSVDPGRSITYRRVEDYWGKDLLTQAGQFNPDVLRFDYYKDENVTIEALKAGEFDFRVENISKAWATAYDVPAVQEGRLIKELIHHENGTGMQGFCFNTRRAKFADPRVRQALGYAFDFEWTNANLFYGQYTRAKSYFSNTELASTGLPEGMELERLEPYRGRVPEAVFTEAYDPPSNEGKGKIRQNLRKAKKLLLDAGWVIQDGKLVHGETGEPMTIEFLLNRASWERIVGPYIQNLERLGVESTIRTVDTAQYQNRLQEFDFDVMVATWGQSLSPGNEQRDRWTTESAKTPGTRNWAGIQDPVVDELVDQLINAPSRESLVATVRALDRVLLWGHYVVPHWYIRSHRTLYWNKFGKPDITAKYTPSYWRSFPPTWWVDADKEAALQAGN